MIPLLAVAAVALAAAAGPVVDRTIADDRITESSGLAVSAQHDGVLWTHDDSGNPPLLFALARSGRVAATVRVTGVPNVDWEAMATFRDRSGRALLAVGDVGDNEARRGEVEVDVVPEPARLASEAVPPLLRLRLRYPDGPRDAETLLVDSARGRMFVVSKGLLYSTVYAVPADAWDGTPPTRPTTRSATLVPVGTVSLTLVTDGTVAPSGAVLLRTYSQLAVFDPFPVSEGRGLLTPRAGVTLPSQRQGEGVALAPGSRAVLLTSEGLHQPVLRVELPADVASAVGQTPDASSSAAGAATSRSSATSSRPTSQGPGRTAPVTAGSANRGDPPVALFGGIAAVLVLLTVVGVRPGARRRGRRSG